MAIYSLDCPNCGAPLSLSDKQSIAMCVYCNSSVLITIAPNAAPIITKIKEISEGVVDEVKRLIIIGRTSKAIEYYAKESGASQIDASTAVNNIRNTIGYNPPLSAKGVFRFFMLELISVLLIIVGIWLIMNISKTGGISAIIVGFIFALMNWSAFKSSLKAYFIAKNGIEKSAKIIKRWDIKTFPATAKVPEGVLFRLLVEVYIENQKPYLTEANCIFGEQSKLKCQPGYLIKVKFSKTNPKKIVITGTN
jgi:DNA-directed RNA polymerase subunit RPC12/RpoP